MLSRGWAGRLPWAGGAGKSTLLRAPGPLSGAVLLQTQGPGAGGSALRMNPRQVQRGLCLPEQRANPGTCPAALRAPVSSALPPRC